MFRQNQAGESHTENWKHFYPPWYYGNSPYESHTENWKLRAPPLSSWRPSRWISHGELKEPTCYGRNKVCLHLESHTENWKSQTQKCLQSSSRSESHTENWKRPLSHRHVHRGANPESHTENWKLYEILKIHRHQTSMNLTRRIESIGLGRGYAVRLRRRISHGELKDHSEGNRPRVTFWRYESHTENWKDKPITAAKMIVSRIESHTENWKFQSQALFTNSSSRMESHTENWKMTSTCDGCEETTRNLTRRIERIAFSSGNPLLTRRISHGELKGISSRRFLVCPLILESHTENWKLNLSYHSYLWCFSQNLTRRIERLTIGHRLSLISLFRISHGELKDTPPHLKRTMLSCW